MPLLGRDRSEEIEPDRVIVVGRVEVNRVVAAAGWDEVEKFPGEVSMGIDHAHASSTDQILNY